MLAKERGEIRPILQLLAYPMLDDRTISRADIDSDRLRVWSQRGNTFGWSSYFGSTVVNTTVPPLAAPARYEDLSAQLSALDNALNKR